LDTANIFVLFVAKHLKPLEGGKTPLEVLVRGKDAAENTKLFETITGAIKESGVSGPHHWSFYDHIKG
jgi:FACT complex subunit SPT16 N-terminal lobe domain